MKRLFVLAGPSCSGKSTLLNTLKGNPGPKVFGDQTRYVKWQAMYMVSEDGKKVSFDTNSATPRLMSIKTLVDHRGAMLVNPPDGLLLHVDLFTLAGVDRVARGQQTVDEIMQELGRPFERLCAFYEQIVICTMEIDRSVGAKRFVERIRSNEKARREWRPSTVRAKVGGLISKLFGDRLGMKVFAIIMGGGPRQRIFILDDGVWFERIVAAWREFADSIATDNYVIRLSTSGGLVIQRLHRVEQLV